MQVTSACGWYRSRVFIDGTCAKPGWNKRKDRAIENIRGRRNKTPNFLSVYIFNIKEINTIIKPATLRSFGIGLSLAIYWTFLMTIYTTEITSERLESDNPIHQRLIKAYYLARPYISGDLLEIGCGEGRGIELLQPLCERYMAVDKIGPILKKLSDRFPGVEFAQMNIPPLSGIPDGSFDRVISFQVIEHIKDDVAYLEEIKRVLKPGGLALITTPNIKFTLTRNPWHVREYLSRELFDKAISVFDEVEIKGISGNQKVLDYYRRNKESVEKITRFDIFNLQYKLPASLLRIPYDILNRINRRKLQGQDSELVGSITYHDYSLTDNAEEGLDLFGILRKH